MIGECETTRFARSLTDKSVGKAVSCVDPSVRKPAGRLVRGIAPSHEVLAKSYWALPLDQAGLCFDRLLPLGKRRFLFGLSPQILKKEKPK